MPHVPMLSGPEQSHEQHLVSPDPVIEFLNNQYPKIKKNLYCIDFLVLPGSHYWRVYITKMG
jgi:hypothetical protein